MTFIIVSSVFLAATTPVSAKSVKYKAEQIGATKTCRDNDPAMPVKTCIKKFAEKFCQGKGHKTYVMANWASSGNGYTDPSLIYCK